MEGKMKAPVVRIGLAISVVLASLSLVVGSGGTASAFGAKNVKTYDSKGDALTRYQLGVKKELARNKTKQN
jgi:hypothetical protein